MSYDVAGILCYGVVLDTELELPWNDEEYEGDVYGWMEDNRFQYPNIEIVLAGRDEEDPYYIITHKDVGFYSTGEPEVVVVPNSTVVMNAHVDITNFCRKELKNPIKPFVIDWYLASSFNM